MQGYKVIDFEVKKGNWRILMVLLLLRMRIFFDFGVFFYQKALDYTILIHTTLKFYVRIQRILNTFT